MRPVRMNHPTVRALMAGLLALMALLAMAAAAQAMGPKYSKKVLIVSKTKTGERYYSKIQAAVEASKKGDWILIEPGEYEEEVKVTKKHGGIFIRGMNRNTVVLNGENIHNPEGANGIEIEKANNVWVENLTVKNFNRASLNGGGGNEIWWNGGEESGKIGAHGWYGKYLTAYDTGLDGGYGIFTSNEEEGEWENIYASGFNDSGIYIGACQECKARVDKATMEYNALGYSGSNSGGKLVIENSLFAHNTSGIAPNSENPGDGPPPANGACEHAPPLKEKRKHQPWEGELPKFSNTEFAHCEIFRDNKIIENNDLTAPANTSAGEAPWGVGIELPGTYGMDVEHNEIIDNPTDGVLAFEYPNPYPEPSKQEKEEGVETIYFQNAGNRVVDNTFEGNGSENGAYAGAIGFEGGLFAPHESLNDCISGNTYVDNEPVYPADIEGEWGCQNKTTPNPGGGIGFLSYLEQLSNESKDRATTEPVGPPPAQTSMENPCEHVPNDPLCEAEKEV